MLGAWWLKYAVIGVVVIGVALWIGALKAQVSHYRERVAELQVWKDTAIAAGQKADEENRAKEQAYAENIKRAEAGAARARADLAGWLSKRRPDSSIPSNAPATPSGTDRAGQVCFDRAGLDAAIGRFRADVAGLVAEGAQAVIDRQECVAGWPR